MRLTRQKNKSNPTRRRVPKSKEALSSRPFQKGRARAALPAEGGSSQGKSPRLHGHYLVKRRRKIAGLLLVATAVMASLYVLMSQFTAQAVVIPPDGLEGRLDESYSELIETYMADNISQHWRFLLDEEELTEYAKQESPEIEAIKLQGSGGFGKSVFKVLPRRPIASWRVEGQQLFVDGEGVPFVRNYYPSPSLSIEDENDVIVGSGQSVASNRFISFVGQVIEASKGQGYKVTRVVITEGTSHQIEIRLKDIDYPVRLLIDRSAEEGVADMVKAIDWFKVKKRKPLYIDARVEGRIFYK